MFLITDKLIGMIGCGVLAGILFLVFIFSIISACARKKQPKNVEKQEKAKPVESKPVVAAAPAKKEKAKKDPDAEEDEDEEEEVAQPVVAAAPVEETKDESEEESEEDEDESEETEEKPAEEEPEEETQESEDESEEEEPAEEADENTEEEPTEESEEESDEETQESEEEEPAEEADENTEEEPTEEPEEESDEETDESEEEEPAEETDENTEEEPTDEPEEENDEESEDEDDGDEEKPAAKKEIQANEKTGRYSGKYVITVDGTDLYRFKLVASNGQSLINSEGYTTEAGCRRGIETIKKNVKEGVIKIDADKHDLYFFNLVTKQNRIIAHSAAYKTRDAAVRASESFQKFALTDNIIFDEKVNKDVSSVEHVDVEFEEKEGGNYHFEKDDNGYIYVLEASNGVKIVTSQDYSSLSGAKDAYQRFKEAVYDGDWMIAKDKAGNFQFKLYKNRRLVVAGELYQAKDQVKNTIASIKSFAKNAEYEDVDIEE